MTMIYRTLVTPETVARHLNDPDWAVIDCRFALADTEIGRRAYLEAHVPGAVYAHLDEDLSSRPIPGQTGRHPLPQLAALTATVSRWGIDEGVQVVVYDDTSGVFAGRLWWMLRWLGHDAVAVMDGDWRHWQQEALPTTGSEESRPSRHFMPRPRPNMLVTIDEIQARLSARQTSNCWMHAAPTAIVAKMKRSTRAGHIPGALSAPYADNLDAAGRFLAPELLRARWQRLLDDTPAEEAVVYCGSGVSAVHNLIAMERAGLETGSELYVGSWSEWIADPDRPASIGPSP